MMRIQTLGFSALAALVVAVLFWLVGAMSLGGTSPGNTMGPGFWGMGPGMMPWAGGAGFGWPSMLLMMGSMLTFWVAVILGLVLLVRWLADQGRHSGPDAVDALELARRRYARGDISREEYTRLRDDLKP